MNGLKASLSKRSAWWFYLLLVATVEVLLTFINLYYCIGYRNNMISPSGLLYFLNIHLGDAVLLLLPYWLVPARHRKWMWSIVALLALWCVAQVLYNLVYQDVMPFSSLVLVSNVGDVLIGSVMGLLSFTSLIPIIIVVGAYLIYRKWVSGGQVAALSFKAKCVAVAASVLVATLTQRISHIYNYTQSQDDMTFVEFVPDDYSSMQARFKSYFIRHGFVAYCTYCACTSIERPITADEKAEIERFINDEMPHYTDNPYSTSERKNLVMIIVESLNSWAIGLTIDGREITPTLNAIARDTTALVALNVKAQVKNGRSSDGKFIYDTGLLPLTGKAVAMYYSDANYPALPKALKGYDAVEVTPDAPGLWNNETNSRSYGFRTIYNSRQFKPRFIANGYRIDEVVFDEAFKVIQGQKQPFFTQVVTGSMHSPYDSPPADTTWISHSKAYTPQVRNYLERAAYTDHHLGIFLKRLADSRLMQNSVIVIASDHTELIDGAPCELTAPGATGNECTLLILNSGHPGRIENIVGQIDVYPTLLDIMGANQYKWKGLGYSLLRTPVDAAAIYEGEVVGNTSSPIIPHITRAWRVSDLLIRKHWFK